MIHVTYVTGGQGARGVRHMRHTLHTSQATKELEAAVTNSRVAQEEARIAKAELVAMKDAAVKGDSIDEGTSAE